jgi:hypothetical protein
LDASVDACRRAHKVQERSAERTAGAPAPQAADLRWDGIVDTPDQVEQETTLFGSPRIRRRGSVNLKAKIQLAGASGVLLPAAPLPVGRHPFLGRAVHGEPLPVSLTQI